MLSQKSSRNTGTALSRRLYLLIAALMLNGCTTSRVPYKPPTLSASLAAPCPPVPAFDSDSWDDLALVYIRLTGQYAECAARKDAVVGAWPK